MTHRPEEINFLGSALPFVRPSEILLEGIIVVFHTLALAAGTHLEKYTQYSAEESIPYNGANWAHSPRVKEMAATHTHTVSGEPGEDEEQKLNVTCKSAHL